MVAITNKAGLHARPISQFVDIASRFQSVLNVSGDGKTVNGKSVLQLMSLATCRELELHADGEDADEMIKALEDLIKAEFYED